LLDNTRRLVVQDDPKSVGSEAFRTLRTNLQYTSPDSQLHTVLFTSAVPGEGKSVVSSNLAVSLAQVGKNIILIDCDLRKPVVHKIFGLNNITGLTNILTGQVDYKEAIQKTAPGVSVITSGPIPPNPAELLQSKNMRNLLTQLNDEFDQVVLDVAPVLPVADALILAPYSDGVVLVVGVNQVSKDFVLRAKDLLENTNSSILGVVLNRVKYSKTGEQYYYNYYSQGHDDA